MESITVKEEINTDTGSDQDSSGLSDPDIDSIYGTLWKPPLEFSEEKRHKCTICAKSYKSENKLAAQNRMAHNRFDNKPLVCLHCDRMFYHHAHLTKHITKHNKVSKRIQGPFKCSICSETFDDKQIFREHKKSHTYDCSTCGKIFATKGQLTEHLICHVDERPFTCAVCGMAFKRKTHLSTHILTHSEDRLFECSTCSKSFRQKASLIKHIKVIHKGVKLPSADCPTCGKKFATKDRLTAHLICHRDDRPFPCAVCEKAFKRRTDLSAHMLTHSQDRLHQCSGCGKSFKRKVHLTAHIQFSH